MAWASLLMQGRLLAVQVLDTLQLLRLCARRVVFLLRNQAPRNGAKLAVAAGKHLGVHAARLDNMAHKLTSG